MDFFTSWQKKINLTTDHQLVGFSRGSFKTGLMIEPLKIFLDAGICSQYEPNLILITHGHTDHIGELYNILIGNSRKFKVPIITTPNLVKLVANYLNSMVSLNRGFLDSYNKCELIGIRDIKRLTIQGKILSIKSYKMDHLVETIGFGISEIRDKLKPEFVGFEQSQLIEIKKTTHITEEKEIPLFLFCGDTGNSILNTLPFDKFPNVIIECTFIHQEHIQESIDRKHLHITDLEPYFIKNKETTFILIHFSSRYIIDEIKEYQKVYEEKYSNVKFFI